MINAAQSSEITQFVTLWLQELYENNSLEPGQIIFILNTIINTELFDNVMSLLEEWDIIDHVMLMTNVIKCSHPHNPNFTPEIWFDNEGNCDIGDFAITYNELEASNRVIYLDPYDNQYKLESKGFLNLIKHNNPDQPAIKSEEVISFIKYILLCELGKICHQQANLIVNHYPILSNSHFVQNTNVTLTQEQLNDKYANALMEPDLSEIQKWLERGAELNSLFKNPIFTEKHSVVHQFDYYIFEFIRYSDDISESNEIRVYDDFDKKDILRNAQEFLKKSLSIFKYLINEGLYEEELLNMLWAECWFDIEPYLYALEFVNVSSFIEGFVRLKDDIHVKNILTKYWINKSIAHGNTLLHYACMYGREQLIKEIINYNNQDIRFNILLENKESQIPFFLVFQLKETKQEEIAEMFAQHKDIDKLIFYCIEKNNTEALALLMTVEANFFCLNKNNQTPFEYAYELGKGDEIITMLRDYMEDKIDEEDDMFLDFKERNSNIIEEISLKILLNFSKYCNYNLGYRNHNL